MCIMEHETGGVIHPEELFINTGERVIDVLRNKQPDARPRTAASLDKYPYCPLEILPMYITKNTVMEVAGWLSGGAGPDDMSSK